jgi:hypothetical protein
LRGATGFSDFTFTTLVSEEIVFAVSLLSISFGAGLLGVALIFSFDFCRKGDDGNLTGGGGALVLGDWFLSSLVFREFRLFAMRSAIGTGGGGVFRVKGCTCGVFGGNGCTSFSEEQVDSCISLVGRLSGNSLSKVIFCKFCDVAYST